MSNNSGNHSSNAAIIMYLILLAGGLLLASLWLRSRHETISKPEAMKTLENLGAGLTVREMDDSTFFGWIMYHVPYSFYSYLPQNIILKLDEIPRYKIKSFVDVVRLQGASISEKNLDILGNALYQVRETKVLNLKNSNIDDGVLKSVKSFETPEVIVLRNCPATDDGIEYLSRHKSLRAMDLSGTKTEGKFLGSFGALKVLEYLDLSSTGIDDSSIENIAGLKSLQNLNLGGSAISNKSLENLKNLEQLRKLDLSGTRIDDEGLRYIPRMRKLSSLDLSRTKITDAGLEHMHSMENLNYLNLKGTDVTESGLEMLGKIRNLHWLDLRESKIDRHYIDQFSKSHADITVFR